MSLQTIVGSLVLSVTACGAGNSISEYQHPLLHAAVEEPSPGPAMEKLKADALATLMGKSQYDDTNSVTVADYEQSWGFSSNCMAIPRLKQKLVDSLSSRGFVQVGSSKQFPRHSIHLVRQHDNNVRDLVILYYTITKEPGLSCHYEVGVFARPGQAARTANSPPMVTTGQARDELNRALDEAVAEVKQRIATFDPVCPLTQHIEPNIIADIQSHATKQPVFMRASAQAEQALNTALARYHVHKAHLYIVNTEELSISSMQYQTSSCTAFADGRDDVSIVCDERFVIRLEAIVRRFEDGSRLMSDEALLRLADEVDSDPRGTALRLRSDQDLAHTTDQSLEHISDHLKLALFFFSAHEIGHYLQCQAGAAWDTRAATVVLPKDVRQANLKLCRHADEFRAAGFSLELQDDIARPFSDMRKFLRAYEQQAGAYQDVLRERFSAESLADEFAIEIAVSHLSSLDSQPEIASFQQHLLLETIFALGLVDWYSRLNKFASVQCEFKLTNVRGLGVCAAFTSDAYLRAHELFGEVHRAVLLRALLLTGAVLSARTDYWTPGSEHTIWLDPDDLQGLPYDQRMAQIRHYGALQRYALLVGIQDSGLKLAFDGCMSGYVRSVRTRPLILFNTFEPIEVEMERLKNWR